MFLYFGLWEPCKQIHNLPRLLPLYQHLLASSAILSRLWPPSYTTIQPSHICFICHFCSLSFWDIFLVVLWRTVWHLWPSLVEMCHKCILGLLHMTQGSWPACPTHDLQCHWISSDTMWCDCISRSMWALGEHFPYHSDRLMINILLQRLLPDIAGLALSLCTAGIAFLPQATRWHAEITPSQTHLLGFSHVISQPSAPHTHTHERDCCRTSR